MNYQKFVTGAGVTVGRGDVITIHFIAWIYIDCSEGTTIFTPYEHDNPVTPRLGTDKVIQGWNYPVAKIKPGGKRLLFILARLADGDRSLDDIIPTDADLRYEIKLMSKRESSFHH